MIQNQGDLRILETIFLNTCEKKTKKEGKERKKAEKMAATKKESSLKKMPTQEASVKSTNEKTRKGKGKATVKDTYVCKHLRRCAMIWEIG